MMNLSELFRLTLIQPRAAGEEILRRGYPMRVGWMVLALGIVGGVLLSAGTSALFGPPPADAPEMMLLSPLQFLVLLAVSQLLLVLGGWKVGQLWGGKGELADVLVLTGWLQLVMLGVQVAVLALALLVPPLLPILNLLAIAVMLRALFTFLALAHGFASVVMVGLGFGASVIGFATALAIVMVLLGIRV